MIDSMSPRLTRGSLRAGPQWKSDRESRPCRYSSGETSRLPFRAQVLAHAASSDSDCLPRCVAYRHFGCGMPRAATRDGIICDGRDKHATNKILAAFIVPFSESFIEELGRRKSVAWRGYPSILWVVCDCSWPPLFQAVSTMRGWCNLLPIPTGLRYRYGYKFNPRLDFSTCNSHLLVEGVLVHSCLESPVLGSPAVPWTLEHW